MKICENFALREIAGNSVVIPLGSETVDLNGILKLNSSGVFLWNTLEKGADVEALADALVAEYEIDRETALSDAESFVEKLRAFGCIEE